MNGSLDPAPSHSEIGIKIPADAHRLKLHLEVGTQAAQDALLAIGLGEHVPRVLVRLEMLQPLQCVPCRCRNRMHGLNTIRQVWTVTARRARIVSYTA